ncbi:MATE family efflux transporter [Aliagarivorans marinus]|uniref:MATE family efflux transporter n=1 Tax=Aliagarivorans marinus TaxID=561965 RepID=UPI0004152676|nr:MATE family efflux transporter [Aliagarivorans marinus]
MDQGNQHILQGKISSTTFKLAMPVIIGHLLLLCYNIADTLFISMIDRESTALISGVGLIFPVYFLFIAISVGLFSGLGSVVSRAIGAKDKTVLESVASSGLALGLVIALSVLVLFYSFSRPLIEALAGSEMSRDAITYAHDYLLFIIPGFCLLVFNNVLLGILQGEGKPQFYGIVMALTTVLNFALDPLFIFTLGMGVAGAALASTLSILCATLLLVYVFVSQRSSLPICWNVLRAKLQIIGQILAIAVPQMLALIILAGGFIALNKLVGSLSEQMMNAWVISGRVNELVLLIGYGIGQASLTMTGQNYGAGQWQRLQQIMRTNLLNTLVLALCFVLLLNLAALILLPLFSAVSEVIVAAQYQIRFLSLAGAAVCIEIVCGNIFQGIGRPFPGLILIFVRMALIVVPLSYWLIQSLGYGMEALLWVSLLSNLASASAATLWCRHTLRRLPMLSATPRTA